MECGENYFEILSYHCKYIIVRIIFIGSFLAFSGLGGSGHVNLYYQLNCVMML